MAQAAAGAALFDELECFDVGDNAKDCALDCLNPFNWGGENLASNARSGTKPGKHWRKEYEKREGKPWPKTADGNNHHEHHKDPIADGGNDVYENIEPMDPKKHHEHPADDRRRWGGRKK